MYAALEAGGTKCVCAIFNEQGEVIERVSISTRVPEESVPEMLDFFKQYPQIKAMGIGSFGPIGVNPDLDDYGHITTTPKPGWQQFDLLGTFKQELQVPIAWTTDVNAAAYGEMKQGAAKDVKNVIYLTIGTGIGGGVVVNGKIISGYTHPELGHIVVRRHPEDEFEGRCPYHKDCLEGLAAGPAIEARWNQSGINLSRSHPAWEIQAEYLAQALYTYYATLSTEKFILGGGVMKQMQLFPLIRNAFDRLNQGYLSVPDLETFIVPPALGDNAGITGCYELARELVENIEN